MLRPVSEVVSARFVDVVLDRVLRQHRHTSVHSVADAFTTNTKLTRRQRKRFSNNHVHCINKYFLVLSAQPLARPTAPLTVDVQLRDKPITYTILSYCYTKLVFCTKTNDNVKSSLTITYISRQYAYTVTITHVTTNRL